MGKFLAGFIVLTALIAGAWMYYLQVYAFYEEVAPTADADVTAISLITGAHEPLLYDDFRAIDADSSPIRYRACFTTPTSHPTLSDTYEPYDTPTPLNAPGWFDCFNGAEIGGALESGAALAFLGTPNIQYGIDRVIAIHEDGRGFVWHQINHCGEAVFDGQPVPNGCPPIEDSD